MLENFSLSLPLELTNIFEEVAVVGTRFSSACRRGDERDGFLPIGKSQIIIISEQQVVEMLNSKRKKK